MEDKALRITKLIEALDISKSKFADSISEDKSVMYKYLNGKISVGDALFSKILKVYPQVSKPWLILGIGNMFTDGSGISSPTEEIKEHDNGIPYFALESAACGALSGFGSALTRNNSDGSVAIPTLRTKDGDIFIQTRGRSMIDIKNPERSIPEGAMVLVRKWTQNFIEWGEIYCIATEGGFVVKRLMPGTSADFVSCVSADSDNYPTYEIPTCDIKSIGRVIAVVSVTTM